MVLPSVFNTVALSAGGQTRAQPCKRLVIHKSRELSGLQQEGKVPNGMVQAQKFTIEGAVLWFIGAPLLAKERVLLSCTTHPLL